jgi:iron complex transport system substrate-binding protein
MVDNSWIKTDRASNGSGPTNATRTKVILTLAIIVICFIATVACNGLGSNATQYKSEGILVDFGDYNTAWTNADLNKDDDPVSLLDAVKAEHMSASFDYVITDGKLTSVSYSGTVYANDADHSWDLWYIQEKEFDAVKSGTYSIKVSDYSVVIWAYTSTGDKPMPAVDATATSIYGYAEPERIVSLSPVCTENVNAALAIQKVVGTDSYSNYPQYIDEGHKDGSISIVGSYTDPSYEAIMNTTPDMVYCDASTYNDVQMAGMLRASNVNAVVLYNGEDINTIIKNVFITGASMGHTLAAQAYILKLNYSVEEIKKTVNGQDGRRVMLTLSNDPSPWIAGNYTYINDLIGNLGGENVFADVPGWTNVTAESVAQKNPDCIIVLDSYKYGADKYDEMMKILSNEWKSTDAYKNGDIYLFAEGLGEMGSRAGPRFVQLMEIMGMAIDPGAYREKPLPKAVGDDYTDYLDITKRISE